jgi:flagellar hook-associated protein 1 FlgK
MGEAKMSSIYGIVNSALSALNTYTAAIDVVSTNIGNVSTTGYSRRQVIIQEKATISTVNGVSGSGVEVTSVERVYNAFLTTQLRLANQEMGKYTAQQESLDAVEQVFSDTSDSSLSSALSSFWNSWQDLVNDPSGSTERSILVNSADTLAKEFNSMSSQLSDIQKGIDKSVVGDVAKVNQIVQKIADLNQKLQQVQAAGQDTNSIKDELDLQVANLSELVNINTSTNTNGQVSIQLASGKPLVEGTSTWLLSTQTNDTTGLKDITWSDGTTSTVVNDDISSGELGGYLDARAKITSYQTQLDTLAQSIITNVNALQTSGYDINGDAGVAFFTGTSAADIAVSTAILADTNLVAAASTAAGAPGDGSNASAIADLQNSLILDGGTATFSDYYSALVSKVGSDTQTADDNYSSQSATVLAAQNQRDSYSGVSVDEEETKLILYQNAYAASAKLITVLDDMMKAILAM